MTLILQGDGLSLRRNLWTNFKETEDLEDYIFTVENHFRQCELPRREWVFGLSTRLTGKVASLMSDIRMSTDDYDEVKAKLLKAAGYTPKQAAVKFHHTKFEDIKSLSADQLIHRGRQLLRRQCKLSEGAEYLLVEGWIYAIMYLSESKLP